MLAFPNAKINLGLNVLRKRTDGYHDIATCMLPVSLSDVLEVVPAERFSFIQSGAKLPDTTENLVVKAYQLLKQEMNLAPVAMHLHKIIPAGSGLGGGSSDAAFTLTTLDQLFDIKLKQNRLLDMAGRLGSDCPFFILNKSCIAREKGDVIEPVALETNNWHIRIIFTNVQVDTSLAYTHIKPRKPQITIDSALRLPKNDWRNVLQNDFETVFFKQYPHLEGIKELLYEAGAFYASLSGSGSAIYGVFDHPIPTMMRDAYPFFDCRPIT